MHYSIVEAQKATTAYYGTILIIFAADCNLTDTSSHHLSSNLLEFVANETLKQCDSAQLQTFSYYYKNWGEANQALIFPHCEIGSETEWGMNPDFSSIEYFLGVGTWCIFFDSSSPF
ncbi:hypothetical protein BO70DRAFT_398356 [Aspergillus heteromorphus CBS 117.55]|uniref:Uncharacterized protein n=1 Tax=Aspergillus heteromorphus CBS 117.55 TaxID=1448321 RepID=A0A317VUG3_9EURO|nr:uncharacterized protein BO70DRAFT_398356 [Aspergillus heteromorphus CBS 117.55]PWY75510.1 hypothetical protein BO70DRAFT_398356 [Aspergillus heteromorphus CBS 117.55]